jgi:hypothetical protein
MGTQMGGESTGYFPALLIPDPAQHSLKIGGWKNQVKNYPKSFALVNSKSAPPVTL